MGYALHAPGMLEVWGQHSWALMLAFARIAVQGLKHYSALRVPLYVTETGFPDATDTQRPRMIDSYMRQVVNALDDPSIDLRGVMHWSLVDNWECVGIVKQGVRDSSRCDAASATGGRKGGTSTLGCLHGPLARWSGCPGRAAWRFGSSGAATFWIERRARRLHCLPLRDARYC